MDPISLLVNAMLRGSKIKHALEHNENLRRLYTDSVLFSIEMLARLPDVQYRISSFLKTERDIDLGIDVVNLYSINSFGGDQDYQKDMFGIIVELSTFRSDLNKLVKIFVRINFPIDELGMDKRVFDQAIRRLRTAT